MPVTETKRTPRRRCVLLFSRGPLNEERAKGIRSARRLFARVEARIARAIAGLDGVDLVVAGAAAGPADAGVRRIGQRGATFGDRLTNAFRDLRSLGYTDIAAVPIDVPALGPAQIARAFRLLDTRDIVLGPSPDGGVYLLASRVDPAPLFAAVPWRTAGVCDALRAAPCAVGLLEPLGDVDSRGDLEALARDATLDAALRIAIRAVLSAPRPAGPRRSVTAIAAHRALRPAPRAPPLPSS